MTEGAIITSRESAGEGYILFACNGRKKTPLQKYNIIHCRGAFHMLPIYISGGYGIRPYRVGANKVR